MPLDFKSFTSMLRGLPADASDEAVNTAAAAVDQGNPIKKVWEWVNKPLVGGKDSALLAHEHGEDEGGFRRVAEDLAAGMTSPLGLATTATGVGAGIAGAKGLLGISKGARTAEAALQVPWAVEGAQSIVEGENLGEKLGGVLEAGGAAYGIRSAGKHAFPAAKVKSTYMKERGLKPLEREAYDPELAKKTADDYDSMAHEPDAPDVKQSYGSLTTQIDDQHKFLAERAGVEMEPWTGPGEPYKSSSAMQADISKNNHLWFLPTDKSKVVGDHPMMQGDANDQFRAVHDYMGHATEGNQFGPKGEQGAFNAHRETLTPDAHGALASETKGQNSWVNSGKHLRNSDGALPKKGEPGFVAPADRPFADQKAGLLPEYQRRSSDRKPASAFYEEPPQTPQPLPQGDELARGVSDELRRPSSVANPDRRFSGAPRQLTVSQELLGDVNLRHGRSSGSSTNLRDGRAVTAEEGRYLLSPYEDRQVKLGRPPTEQDLRNFVAKNEDLLSQPGHNLGTWFNAEGDKKHYIDVAIGESDLAHAQALGKQHKQLAIYDMVEGKDISLEDAVPPPPAKKAASAHGDAEIDNMRRNAPYGEGSIMPSAMRPTEFSKLGMAIASPAAASAIDDSDPNDPNRELKTFGKALLNTLGVGGAVASVGYFPKDLKSKLDSIKLSTIKSFRDKGEVIRSSVVKANIRKGILEGEKDPKKAQLLEGLYHTIELPKFEGVNFDQRRPVQELLKKSKKETSFKQFTTSRLDKAYEVGDKAGSVWGNPQWIADLVDHDPELSAKFGRTMGALSPGTPTDWNSAQAAEVFVRHVLNEEPLASVLGDMKTFSIQNRRGKELNLDRMSKGGRIFQDKTENLSGNELGVGGRIPIDMWLLRAFGSHTDKTPGRPLYRAFEDAFTKYSGSKPDGDPFTVMAKIWTGMQKIAGAETPSWENSFKKMGVTGDLTNPEYRQWFIDNASMIRRRLLNEEGKKEWATQLAEIPEAPKTKASRPVDDNYRQELKKSFLQTQARPDVLGKARVPKKDMERLLEAMKRQGIDFESEATPF